MTAAFTGHRTYEGQADKELSALLIELYERGYRRFLTGMAWGFDLAAGCAVIDLKHKFSEVELVAVEPFHGFRSLFRGADLELYDKVLDAADERLTIHPCHQVAAYYRRNDFLVEESSTVVAWWNGLHHGGTAYTVKRALKSHREVINLYQDPYSLF